MKYLLLLIVMPFLGNSQIVTEHLLEYNKSYNPLFSKEKGSMNLKLELIYSLGKKDSTMLFTMDISQRKIKLEGTTNSVNSATAISAMNRYGLIGALGLGLSSSKTYSFNDAKGICYLDFKSFDSLIVSLSAIDDFFRYPSSPPKTLVFTTNKIVIGADMSMSVASDGKTISLEKAFYTQIDDSIYKLSESDYNEFKETLLKIKKVWDGYNKDKIFYGLN